MPGDQIKTARLNQCYKPVKLAWNEGIWHLGNFIHHLIENISLNERVSFRVAGTREA
jgi:hypothetical protein